MTELLKKILGYSIIVLVAVGLYIKWEWEQHKKRCGR